MSFLEIEGKEDHGEEDNEEDDDEWEDADNQNIQVRLKHKFVLYSDWETRLLETTNDGVYSGRVSSSSSCYPSLTVNYSENSQTIY